MLVHRKRGVALIAALLVILILVIVAASFVRIMAGDVRTSRMAGDSSIAFYTAEAGLEYARWLHKHNMALYPRQDMPEYNSDGTVAAMPLKRGTVYNIPIASADDFTGVTESSAYGVNSPDCPEHIFVNDLAFYDENSVFGDRKYCATFQLRESSKVAELNPSYGPGAVVTIYSTGRIREVPDNWVWGTDSIENGTYSSKALEDCGFKEVYKRTVVSELRITSFDRGLTGKDGMGTGQTDLYPVKENQRYYTGSGYKWHEWAR